MKFVLRCLVSKSRDVRRFGRECLREQFWGAVMDRFPGLYRLCEKLPVDTLPF